MHILIVTSDGVGSSIIQRFIAINLYLNDQKPLLTHEMLNGGLVQNNGIVQKDWNINFTRSLSDTVSFIKKYGQKRSIVARHSKHVYYQRNDSARDREIFDKFLQEYFDRKVICMRRNVFDQALSQAIRTQIIKTQGTDNALIFNAEQKKQVLSNRYVDEDVFVRKLEEYTRRIDWAKQKFPDAIEVYYEDALTQTDKMLADVTGYRDSFKQKFGTDYQTICKMEYDAMLLQAGVNVKKPSKDTITAIQNYRAFNKKLIDEGVISNPIPVKNTTLTDKKNLIKNFDDCWHIFEQFADKHPWVDKSVAGYDFWNKTWLKNRKQR